MNTCEPGFWTDAAVKVSLGAAFISMWCAYAAWRLRKEAQALRNQAHELFDDAAAEARQTKELLKPLPTDDVWPRCPECRHWLGRVRGGMGGSWYCAQPDCKNDKRWIQEF